MRVAVEEGDITRPWREHGDMLHDAESSGSLDLCRRFKCTICKKESCHAGSCLCGHRQEVLGEACFHSIPGKGSLLWRCYTDHWRICTKTSSSLQNDPTVCELFAWPGLRCGRQPFHRGLTCEERRCMSSGRALSCMSDFLFWICREAEGIR